MGQLSYDVARQANLHIELMYNVVQLLTGQVIGVQSSEEYYFIVQNSTVHFCIL